MELFLIGLHILLTIAVLMLSMVAMMNRRKINQIDKSVHIKIDELIESLNELVRLLKK